MAIGLSTGEQFEDETSYLASQLGSKAEPITQNKSEKLAMEDKKDKFQGIGRGGEGGAGGKKEPSQIERFTPHSQDPNNVMTQEQLDKFNALRPKESPFERTTPTPENLRRYQEYLKTPGAIERRDIWGDLGNIQLSGDVIPGPPRLTPMDKALDDVQRQLNLKKDIKPLPIVPANDNIKLSANETKGTKSDVRGIGVEMQGASRGGVGGGYSKGGNVENLVERKQLQNVANENIKPSPDQIKYQKVLNEQEYKRLFGDAPKTESGLPDMNAKFEKDLRSIEADYRREIIQIINTQKTPSGRTLQYEWSDPRGSPELVMQPLKAYAPKAIQSDPEKMNAWMKAGIALLGIGGGIAGGTLITDGLVALAKKYEESLKKKEAK